MDLSKVEALERELVKVEIPPKAVEILKVDEAGKGEPAFVLYVRAKSPEEIKDLLNPNLADLMQNGRGFRRNGAALKAATEEQAAQRRAKWIKEVLEPRWEGATLGNINFLLRAAGVVLDPEQMPTLKAIWGDGQEAAYHPSLVDLLLRKCRDEDFDRPIAAAAASWAEEYLAEQQGNASA